jgi:hypothetical protein
MNIFNNERRCDEHLLFDDQSCRPHKMQEGTAHVVSAEPLVSVSRAPTAVVFQPASCFLSVAEQVIRNDFDNMLSSVVSVKPQTRAISPGAPRPKQRQGRYALTLPAGAPSPESVRGNKRRFQNGPGVPLNLFRRKCTAQRVQFSRIIRCRANQLEHSERNRSPSFRV